MHTLHNWKEEYTRRGVLWTHDGNPNRPHAILGSGLHSVGYFKSELILNDPLTLAKAAIDIVFLLRESDIDIDDIDRVIGPALSGVTFAYEIARQIALNRSRTCLTGYTERDPKSEKKVMIFNRSRINAGERILIVDDVFTTGESSTGTAETVEAAGGIVLPFLCVLANRSHRTMACERKVISLIQSNLPQWHSHECPLCKQGSKALRPKEAGENNWEKLHANY